MEYWIEISDGRKFCSKECFEKILPLCLCCKKPMKTWIEYSKSGKFCDESCYKRYQNRDLFKIDINSNLTVKELSYLTGLTPNECFELMDKNKIDGDSALEMIDIYMQSLNNGLEVPAVVLIALKKAGVHIKLADHLGKYNTMRGGVKGYKGFVFEELHVADVAARGSNISVLNNNGLADFVEFDSIGNKIYFQAKAGYKPGQIDWSRYKDMTIVVDKGNTALFSDASSAGLKVVESNISLQEASLIARAQQFESNLLKTSNAPITANMVSAHSAAIQNMKFAAKIGVGFNIGSNIYDVLDGHKDFAEATVDIIVESGKFAGATYIGSGVITLAGSMASTFAETSVGGALIETAAMAGAAITDTTIGGMIAEGIVGGIEFVTGTITSMTSAPLIPLVGGAAILGFAWKALIDE